MELSSIAAPQTCLRQFGQIRGQFAAWMPGRIRAFGEKFNSINAKFDGINQRFNDMVDLWRAELHRVEEVIDARLKHLEQM